MKICIIQSGDADFFVIQFLETIFRITCSSADRGSQRGALPG